MIVGAALLFAACGGGGAECARSSDCEAPLVCRAGSCEEECIEDRDCELGTTCQLVLGGHRACVLPGELPCSETMPCDESLLCVESSCRIRCTSSADCSMGEACVDGGGGMLACVASAPP